MMQDGIAGFNNNWLLFLEKRRMRDVRNS